MATELESLLVISLIKLILLWILLQNLPWPQWQVPELRQRVQWPKSSSTAWRKTCPMLPGAGTPRSLAEQPPHLGKKMALWRKFSKTFRYSASSFSACFSASVFGQAQQGPFSPPGPSGFVGSAASSASMTPSAYLRMGTFSVGRGGSARKQSRNLQRPLTRGGGTFCYCSASPSRESHPGEPVFRQGPVGGGAGRRPLFIARKEGGAPA